MTRNRTTSLVIVDTDAYVLARRALELSIERFPVNDVLVFSDDADRWKGFGITRIKKISSLSDYNRLLLSGLADHLRTEFALVIQFDGFVINPVCFSDTFFDYDYIGAPWPPALVNRKETIVGNGGFSLRSARLVEATARKYQRFIDFELPEDATICRYLRPMLEELEHIRYAPAEVARRFSIEFETGIVVAPFGFHGLHFLPMIYSAEYEFLIENLPARSLMENNGRLSNFRQACIKHLPAEGNALLTKRIAEANST